MDIIINFFDLMFHLDQYISEIFSLFGIWIYVIIFLVIFSETGLVVLPFLPGDSLLFVLGALSAKGDISTFAMGLTLMIAAILGNTVNYHVGSYMGIKVFEKEKIRFIKKEHLEKTHVFYEQHGKKTIIIARFLPIIRTFAPFVAGIAKMNYFAFQLYNIIGSGAWVWSFIIGGYYFGNIPWVQNNLMLIVIIILICSFIPAIYAFLQTQKNANQSKLS